MKASAVAYEQKDSAAVRRRYERAIRAAEAQLLNIIRREYIAITEAAFLDVSEQVGVTLSFDLNSRNVKHVLSGVGVQVKGITEESLATLRALVDAGIDRGLSVDALAKELRTSIAGWSDWRALMIARTETARAYTWASIAAYRDSGLVKSVVCYDSSDCGWIGHDDSDKPNGTERSLTEAESTPTSHPNCVRAFGPVVVGA